jgi:hypothetical protein
MKSLWSTALCVFLLVGVNALAARSDADFAGRWEVTTSYPGGSLVAELDLTAHNKGHEEKSGYLVPDCCWYAYSGSLEGANQLFDSGVT